MRPRLLPLLLLSCSPSYDVVSGSDATGESTGASTAPDDGSTSADPASTGSPEGSSSSSGDDSSGSEVGDGMLEVIVRNPYNDPVPDAGVALHFSGADPMEEVTDADGRVVFEGFVEDDVSSVISHKDGWRFASVSAGFIQSHFAGGPVELFISPFGVPGSHVEVSGTAANMNDTGHRLGVVPTNMRRAFLLQNLISGSPHFGSGPDWALPIKSGEAFTLVAFEFDDTIAQPPQGQAQEIFGWFVIDHRAVEAATTIDVDFAVAAPPTIVTGSFLKPADPALAEFGDPSAYVDLFDAGRGSQVGATRLIEESADETAYDYEIEYVDVPGFDTVTEVQVHIPGGGVLKIIDGPPPGGTVDLEFLTPPKMFDHDGLLDPMSWTLAEDESYDRILVDFEEGLHQLAPGETETFLPPLPTTSDASALFQGAQLVVLSTCGDVRDRAACFETSFSSFVSTR